MKWYKESINETDGYYIDDVETLVKEYVKAYYKTLVPNEIDEYSFNKGFCKGIALSVTLIAGQIDDEFFDWMMDEING